MIVGISGWKRSGKDEAAKTLQEVLKFKKVSFADVLKQMTAEQYGVPIEYMYDQDKKEIPLLNLPAEPVDDFTRKIHEIMGSELVKGFDGKLYWSPRALLILEGSVKRSVKSSYWVERALSQIKPGDLAVIPDLRYKSEAAQIREYADSIGQKSLLIRINRFETSPSQDPSERDLDNFTGFDRIIENKSTLEEFKENVLSLVFERI